jgi:hypothetical protein
LEFSPDQLEVFAAIQAAVFQGAFQAVALPRGSGKTTICEIACIWSLIYAHKEFVMLVAANTNASKDSLNTIKMHLEHCELLRADYPLLDRVLTEGNGSALRASRLMLEGKSLNFVWRTTEISIPVAPERSGSLPCLAIAGVEGRIRGIKRQTVDGRSLRPDLILIDDIQTRASAESPSKVLKRERVIKSDIAGLAGPGRSMSGMIACTVIKPDDLADRILDRSKNPQFRGIRGKLVYKMPDNMDQWESYFQVRADSLLEHGDNREGNEFYLQHRETMDQGAEVAWEQRKRDDQISGLQYAMDLLSEDKMSFYSEYQNTPLDEVELTGQDFLTPKQVREKATRAHQRGIVPRNHTKLTAFVDVQKNLLYYVVMAWNETTYGGHIVDYGSYPDQKSNMYKANEAPVTFSKMYPGLTLEAQLFESLNTLVSGMFLKEWLTEDEAPLKIQRCLIDAGYSASTETVFTYCKQSVFAPLVDPSFGRYFGAATTPMNNQKKLKGEIRGNSWTIPPVKSGRRRRYVLYDTNFYKSFVTDRLKLSLGDPGTISIFGEPERHEMLSQHLTSEVSINTSGRGRELQEWKIRGTFAENHLFDCLVGAAVAASMEGLKTSVELDAEHDKRRRVSHGSRRNIRRRESR